jgi:tRNA threonylcarbamoyladenosine biosynthesis protein TsaE
VSLPVGSHTTHSQDETFNLGYSIGQELEGPCLFLLQGDLGAGKTVFAKGLICGLGCSDPDDVTSPSFTLINEYQLRLKVFHIDLYRLESLQEIQSLYLEELFEEPAVIVVEWAERLQNMELGQAIMVKIEDLGSEDRRITISQN